MRPGGLALTEALIDLAGFGAGDRVADVGCGLGASTRLLIRRGVAAVGVDVDAEADRRAVPFVAADAARLPFADESFDGVLAECVLSTLADRAQALCEWARVLKPRGRLALTDVTSRAGAGAGRLATAETLLQSMASAGFSVERFEDRSDALKRWVAEFIFAYGSLDALCGGAGGIDGATLGRARPGYALVVARKSGRPYRGGASWLTNLFASRSSCSKATPAGTFWRSWRSKPSAAIIRTSCVRCPVSQSAWDGA